MMIIYLIMPSEKFTPSQSTTLPEPSLQKLAKVTARDRLVAIARATGLLKLLLLAKRD